MILVLHVIELYMGNPYMIHSLCPCDPSLGFLGSPLDMLAVPPHGKAQSQLNCEEHRYMHATINLCNFMLRLSLG